MGKAKSKTDSKELIYVIAGNDAGLVNIEYEKLIDKLLEPDQRAMCLLNADASRASITEILDELRTLPFVADKRVVTVKQADDFISENRSLLEKYFDEPCPTGILILTVSSWQSNTKLAKKLASGKGKLISFSETKAWQLPQKLMNYCVETYDKQISKAAAELLVELSGDSLASLYGEVDKLALYVGDEKFIKPSHVEALVGHNRLFNAFAVIDAIAANNAGLAVSRLREMFEKDRSAEFTFVGAFAYHLRRMFAAKAMLDDGVSTNSVASKLRIWGNKEGFFAQLRKMSLNQIGSYISQLAQTDYEIKTGRTNPRIAAEKLAFKLAAK